MTVVLAALVGLTVGATVAWLSLRRRPTARPPAQERPRPVATSSDLLLELLPTATVLLTADGRVRYANHAARDLQLVRGDSLAVAELRAAVAAVRRTRISRELRTTLAVADGVVRRDLAVGVRVEPIGEDVALVVDDLTESTRVESVRRDFVANVGHEIKTPVGAVSLLTEAALEAQDDPEAVRRFLHRMQHESARLARLVQELLDLSRLQGGEPPPEPAVVAVDDVVEEAVDRVRPAAEAKRIAIVVGGVRGLHVSGSDPQLVTALSNLLENAVAYSTEGTRVAIGVRRRDNVTEVSVSDEGIGIAETDLERVFERFYRADPARSRATGGTGLGLAIVKHIISNHGGEVTAWSRLGEGSTFTVRLPAVDDGARSPEEVERT